MGMLAAMFPAAQLVITGVLGPSANAHAHAHAHGPDELLHLAMVKGATVAMPEVLTAQIGQTTRMKAAA